jgi:hypothetical protein
MVDSALSPVTVSAEQRHELEPYLDDLESRIDDSQESAIFEQWQAFATGAFTGDLFKPVRSRKSAPTISWPRIYVNDALDSIVFMALQQLGACSSQLANGGGYLLSVRSNYGTPILPSVFGAEIFRMEHSQDTLPCSRAMTKEQLRTAIEHGVPDLRHGFGRAALDAGEWFSTLFADYPNIKKHVALYHPDTQGPMDICEMLRGSDLFEDVYEDPLFLHALLALVTQTYIAYMKRWQKIVPPRADGVAVHWGMLHRGTVMLRDDSAMNFSGRMYEEFIMPYERQILDTLGGGAVHFCGRGDHFVMAATSLHGMAAVNMTQPEFNNLDIICRATVDKGIQLLDFPARAVEALVAAGHDLGGNVHVA